MLQGNIGNDTLNGDDGDDVLRGHDGADTLNGGLGDDTHHGYAGDDTIDGGEGGENDGGDWVLYNGNPRRSGVDVQFNKSKATGGWGTDKLSNLENIFGSNSMTPSRVISSRIRCSVTPVQTRLS